MSGLMCRDVPELGGEGMDNCAMGVDLDVDMGQQHWILTKALSKG